MNRVVTLSFALALSALAASSAVAGPVKISQVYGAAVANNAGNVNGDFVELVNTGAVPVDMSNWAVSIATGTGTYAWTKINIPAGTILQPNRHYTLRLQTLAGAIVYNQDQTGASANLAPTNGAVAVMANQIALTAGTCPIADPDMVDIFGYGTSLCFLGTVPSAAAHTAGSNQAFTRNSDGCANTSDNAADFTLAAANPRLAGGLAGTAAYTPATPIQIGQTITFTGSITGVSETVCSGSPAPSTGQTATIDLSEIGGSAGTPMTPLGGGAFTLDFTVPNTATGGNKNVRLVGSDAEGRTVTGVLPVTLAIQPAPTVDFGTLSLATGFYSHAAPLTGGEVHWYKIVLSADASIANNTYLDIDTENSARTDATVYDTYLAMFDNTGAVRSSDDDDGSGLHSQLSYGQTTPTRPTWSTNGGAAGVAYNGRDGDLVAGTYWLAAYGFANAAGSPGAGWIVQSTSAQTGTLQVNLFYAQPAAQAAPSTFDNLGTLAMDGNFVTRSSNVTSAGQVNWYKINLATPIATASRTYLDIDTETSTAGATVLGLFNAATGALVVTDTVDGTDSLSQISIGRGTRPAPGNGLAYNGRDGTTLAVGEYFIAVTSAPGTMGAGWYARSISAATGGTLVMNVRAGSVPLPPPPTVLENLGTLVSDGNFITRSSNVASAGQVNWYKFTLATGIDRSVGTYLDIDTETSTVTTTALGLYSGASAGLVVSDTVDGTASLSQISIGKGTRPAPGNGVAYTGRDGVTLAAGEYYIAVTSAPATFAADYVVTSTNTGTGGSLVLNIRTGTQPPATPPANYYDIGLLHGDKTVDTENGSPIAYSSGQIRWFKFVTPQDANDVTGKYLDIDSEGSVLDLITTRANDTELGVYAQSGALMGSDDDGGVDWTSLVTFGATTPARPTIGNGTARNGNDGVLPAGTYYIAFGGFNVTYAEDFVATTTATVAGTVVLHLFNNFTNPGPTPCNAADVAGLGGTAGPDHQLTADDIIVYLDAFFSNNLAIADIAVLGGTPGHDGQLTADDLIYFLDQFFRPCNP